MIKLVLISIIHFIFYFSVVYPSNPENNLFNKLRQEYEKYSPRDYISRITGSKISESLKKIPKEAYCKDKNKLPTVSYIFLEGGEESIIVEDVENPFINRFQVYIEIYRKAKWFLDTKKSFSELEHILYWKIIKEDKKEYIIKTRQKRFRKTDFLILHISKKDYTIGKAIQYSNKKEIASLLIRYGKVNNYKLPYKLSFFIREKDKITNFSLNMSGYKVNTGLDSDTLINLQDDCPSLSRFY